MIIKESFNVTFNESLPKPRSSHSVEDDRIDEPIVQDLNGLPSLQVNVLDKENRMDGMEFNKDPILVAGIKTTLFELINNEQPEDTSRISEIKVPPFDLTKGEKESKAQKESKAKKVMIRKSMKLRKQRAIAYMRVAKLCKAHKVKENQEKDKIGSKPDENGKRGEAWKSQNQLQSREKEKLKKIQVEGPEMQIIQIYLDDFPRSSSKLSRDQTSNPTSSTNPTPKGRIRRSSKQKVENSNFEEHLTPVATMTDKRTMAEMLRAPTEGCAEAIVVPLILAEQFELKHSLINMMTSEQFFGLEKDNPHDHIHWFNKITSTIKYKDVPNSVVKLILFPFSLAGAARQWLEKEPPRSITTWDDLVSKFINEFFPPSRTTNLRNEISNFQQKFDESFHEAWERYKDLLRACPHHDFTELHQLDTFYNALNPADQDSLNAAAGGNLLEKKSSRCVNVTTVNFTNFK
nr:reverse transcriptase domain-containing protein [Tanacetum cinerariifolium]